MTYQFLYLAIDNYSYPGIFQFTIFLGACVFFHKRISARRLKLLPVDESQKCVEFSQVVLNGRSCQQDMALDVPL